MIFVLTGPKELFQREIEKIIVASKFEEEERFVYDLEEISLFSLLEKIKTISFLSPKKIVILKNAFFLGGEPKRKIEDEELSSFLEYLNHPFEDVLLILTTDKLDERKKKLLKVIREKTKIISLSYQFEKEIDNFFKGYEIEKEAKDALLEAVKGEEGRLASECEKLKLYKLSSKKITKEDIEELVSFSLPNQEDTVFSFSNALARKDKKETYQAYQNLKKMGVDSLSLMGLLESQYRALYQVKLLSQERKTKEKIAEILAMHPFRVQKMLEIGRLYSKEEIQNLLQYLASLDFEFKSGKIEEEFLIDLLILRV